MKKISLFNDVRNNPYPGRGIVVGVTDSCKALAAYFLMGRSVNSRNRIFVEDGDGIRTKAYDESKLTDPRLIIYPAVRTWGGLTIISNGDQTDNIYAGLKKGRSFETSLRGREFEPDAPNYTPRMSAVLHTGDGFVGYAFNLIKTEEGNPEVVLRYTFDYMDPPLGEGRFIHTYKGPGDPLPSFEGDPKRIELTCEIDEFAETLWSSLNEDNKVALFVRTIDIETGEVESRIINKHK